MSEHRNCHECGGSESHHFDGCIYEGTSDVGGRSSYGRCGSSITTGKCWGIYVMALVIGYGINELLGVIIIIALILGLIAS